MDELFNVFEMYSLVDLKDEYCVFIEKDEIAHFLNAARES